MNEDTLKILQETFISEAKELLEKAEAFFLSLEKKGDHKNVYIELKRILHNFKGSSRTVGFAHLSHFSHQIENLLIAIYDEKVDLTADCLQLLLDCNDKLVQDIQILEKDRETHLSYDDLINKINSILQTSTKNNESAEKEDFSQKNFFQFEEFKDEKEEKQEKTIKKETHHTTQKDDSVRIPMQRIDDLLDSFGEQIIMLSLLEHFCQNFNQFENDITKTIFSLKKMLFDIQQSILGLRMVNLRQIYSKMERAVRDASKITQKKVRLSLIGAEQLLDKSIVDQLSDPLNHMVRNAVDHGIETQEQRSATGKPEEGHIEIVARREGGACIIEIKDDGKGLDEDAIRKKGIERGLLSPNDTRTGQKLFDLIFESGFSTKENVSELSGRGVGMNVVKEMIDGLKGICEIESEKGKGSVFRIKMPLSLSLYNAIIFDIYGQKYAVPSSQISEIVNKKDTEIRFVSNKKKVIQIREDVFDFIETDKILNTKKTSSQSKNSEMVFVSLISGRKVGFLVHDVHAIQKIVQKPLSSEMLVCPGAVGVTILPDGMPAMILDFKLILSKLNF